MENAYSAVPSTSGRFGQVAGMKVEFDPSKPGIDDQVEVTTPSRIKSLVVMKGDGSGDDIVVEDFALMGDPARTFVLATNEFLLTGGDGYNGVAAGRVLVKTEDGEQKILEDYIMEALGGMVDIKDPPEVANVVQV
eukprot:CAMPEP_0116838606 /NCGR_PEP_ID=MMETSP0418-20121206/9307_1 /TAXON_ID=1158023 /ORGANISM="Astrosyne radiata, Strain 13vi08-1A" /LENGTH=135 /DNA_ID=CAMNT_0004468629 /DNA_START=19 /DNA_END=426 /DNA_ORIENTATION=+